MVHQREKSWQIFWQVFKQHQIISSQQTRVNTTYFLSYILSPSTLIRFFFFQAFSQCLVVGCHTLPQINSELQYTSKYLCSQPAIRRLFRIYHKGVSLPRETCLYISLFFRSQMQFELYSEADIRLMAIRYFRYGRTIFLLFTLDSRFFAARDDVIESVMPFKPATTPPCRYLFVRFEQCGNYRICDILFSLFNKGFSLLPLHLLQLIYASIPSPMDLVITHPQCLLCNIPKSVLHRWKYGNSWFTGSFHVTELHNFDFSPSSLARIDGLFNTVTSYDHITYFVSKNFNDLRYFKLHKIRYFFLRLLKCRILSLSPTSPDVSNLQMICNYIITSARGCKLLSSLELEHYELILINDPYYSTISRDVVKCYDRLLSITALPLPPQHIPEFETLSLYHNLPLH